jgi:hypothetical protein
MISISVAIQRIFGSEKLATDLAIVAGGLAVHGLCMISGHRPVCALFAAHCAHIAPAYRVRRIHRLNVGRRGFQK